jgi:protein ImuA
VRNSVPDDDSKSRMPSSGGDEAGGPDRGLIEALRSTIRGLEHVPVSFGHPPAPKAPLVRLACSPADHADTNADADTVDTEADLPPLHRLGEAGLHELKPDAHADTPASVSFALCVLSLLTGHGESQQDTLLWCLTDQALAEWGVPYGPGLISLGLDPARILIVRARRVEEAAWALEEGLKSGALAILFGQVAIAKPVMARRLSLAAKAGGLPCLLLTEARSPALPGALTRWRIAARQSPGALFDKAAPGGPAWHLVLERCRAEPPGRAWNVEWRDATHGFRLSHRLADRTADAGEEAARGKAAS